MILSNWEFLFDLPNFFLPSDMWPRYSDQPFWFSRNCLHFSTGRPTSWETAQSQAIWICWLSYLKHLVNAFSGECHVLATTWLTTHRERFSGSVGLQTRVLLTSKIFTIKARREIGLTPFILPNKNIIKFCLPASFFKR